LYEKIKLAVLILPSNKKIVISFLQLCLIGRQSNIFKKYEKKGKAGCNAILGKKPIVRGVAKNPVDHPHGGRTKSIQPEVSP
jgi:large subunit ribosomal protein L2